MKVRSLEIDNFLGRRDKLHLIFQDDLNILTGRNGAGKTSIMKLMWYLMSGNIFPALKEVDFKRAQLITDLYDVTVHKLTATTCRVDIVVNDERLEFEDVLDEDGDAIVNAEDQANDFLEELGASVFFPTFRRIEGGFTLYTDQRGTSSAANFLRPNRSKNDVEEALTALARKLTNRQHTFVTSISTVDIVSLLFRRYTDLSEESSRLQARNSQEITDQIRYYEFNKTADQEAAVARDLIQSIRDKIEAVESEREKIMSPINAIQTVMSGILKHSGIKFGDRLSFGDAASAVNSDVLSAGEKQMMSFVAYNGFFSDSVVFIDEPELSLHVDWQRQLFPTLMKQQTSNQFILATHSPFIYGKYPDKELQIMLDRGCSE